MATKADHTVTLLLLNAATRDYSQAERTQLRVEVLGQLGLTEQEAAEQVATAMDKAEQAAAKGDTKAADDEAADAEAPAAKG